MDFKHILIGGSIMAVLASTGCSSNNTPSRNQANVTGQRLTNSVNSATHHRDNDSLWMDNNVGYSVGSQPDDYNYLLDNTMGYKHHNPYSARIYNDNISAIPNINTSDRMTYNGATTKNKSGMNTATNNVIKTANTPDNLAASIKNALTMNSNKNGSSAYDTNRSNTADNQVNNNTAMDSNQNTASTPNSKGTSSTTSVNSKTNTAGNQVNNNTTMDSNQNTASTPNSNGTSNTTSINSKTNTADNQVSNNTAMNSNKNTASTTNSNSTNNTTSVNNRTNTTDKLAASIRNTVNTDSNKNNFTESDNTVYNRTVTDSTMSGRKSFLNSVNDNESYDPMVQNKLSALNR